MNMRELGRGANSRLVMTCHLFRATNIPVFFSCGVAIVTLLLGSNLLQWPIYFFWRICSYGRRRDRGSTKIAMITMAVLLLSSCGISVGEPILTIQSPDGDVIDCLNTMDQPSLKNPLLKNHIFQETPSDHVKREDDGFGLQVWHSEGITCPRGTIPIRRFDKNISHTKYDPLVPNAADRATKGHKAKIKWQPVYGTKASLSVWSPIVEFPADFSLAQIWLVSGQYEENNLNTIEAGWQVSLPEQIWGPPTTTVYVLDVVLEGKTLNTVPAVRVPLVTRARVKFQEYVECRGPRENSRLTTVAGNPRLPKKKKT
ncbi:unnamed protein product [Brassica napus]|uniref:(rape) hypothetical protein n=1 Tax=Brassica napus TaxID=3708 RepID=A0A816KXW4_BRANA|nr:unnamed protein product [Brassica napus]